MSFYAELDHLSLDELIAHFKGPSPEGEEYAYVYYAEVADFIRQQDKMGIDFLWNEAGDADTSRLRAIIFALTRQPIDQPQIRDWLLAHLNDERPMIVAEVIDGLRRQGTKDAVDKILPLLKHLSPYVRSSVLRFMRSLHSHKVLPLLIEALQDPDFIVRENAADELGELGKVKALPHLRKLLSDSHDHVRQAAQTAIKMLES